MACQLLTDFFFKGWHVISFPSKILKKDENIDKKEARHGTVAEKWIKCYAIFLTGLRLVLFFAFKILWHLEYKKSTSLCNISWIFVYGVFCGVFCSVVSFAVYCFLSCHVPTKRLTYITCKYFINTHYSLLTSMYYFYVLFILWQVPQKQDTAKDTISKFSAIMLLLTKGR